jgi:crossover junction endodeoxyribonuclease RusA
MIHDFRIPHPPQVKQRPRMGRKGRVYTPAKTLEYERLVAESYDGPMFEGHVSLTVMLAKLYTDIRIEDVDKPFYYLRGDVTNYVKAVEDGLNKVAYADDRQIVRIRAIRL